MAAGGAVGSAVMGEVNQAGHDAMNFGLQNRQASIAWDRWKYAQKRQVQWRVDDMRKAGLNPILAVGGTGGSVPMPQKGNATGQPRGESLVTHATKTADARLKTDTAQAQRYLTAYYAANTKQVQALALKTMSEKRLLDSKIPVAEADRDYYNTDAGRAMRMIQRTIQSIPGSGVLLNK